MFIIAPRIMISNISGVDSHRVKIVIHFGMKPVSGGIPLRERSIIGTIICIIGDIVLILLNCLLFC